MAENITDSNEFEELSSLYEIRAEMNEFCQNENNEYARIGVLSAYEKLLGNNDDLRSKINDAIQEHILKQLTMEDFNYFKYKTSSEADDKKRRSSTNKSKTQNAETALIRKQISEEIAFQTSKKDEFKKYENAEIVSISVDKDNFNVVFKEFKEPLKLKHYTYKGKHFSSLGRADILASKPQKSGIDNKAYKMIAAKGTEGYVLQELNAPQDLGKRYSPAEYRALWGLKRSTELSPRQKDELEFLNKLNIDDQKAYLIAVGKRKILLALYKEISDYVVDIDDKFALLIEPEKLRDMFEKNQIEDFIGKMQKQFVHYVQKDKAIWGNFSKTDEEKVNQNQRFSRYEILQNNVISRNSELFAEVYNADFENHDDIKKKISDCFSKIRHLSVPELPDGLCAEIMTQGIFKEAMSGSTCTEKLDKMNKILNEFNLNIEFKSLPVSKVPSDEISSAAEQNKIDRQNFEQLKRGKDYLSEDELFAAELKMRGVGEVNTSSTHHYIALKYNAFVEPELNDNAFLVRTAQLNAWNYDGHNTTHLFDTTGEFLIKNERGEYSFSDFNNLRNRFKSGEKMEIQAPILQTFDNDGVAHDLLALGENGHSGQYISDNSTAQVMRVPDYCRSGIIPNLTLALKRKSSGYVKKA